MIFAAVNIDVSQIIGLCVLVISFLSWFVNLFQNNQQAGAAAKQQRPKPKAVQSEIEALLEQLTGEKPKPKPPRREQPAPVGSPPRPPKPQRDRGKNASRTPSTRNIPQGPLSPSAGGPSMSTDSRLGAPILGTSNLGGEVRSHTLGNRVEAAVQREITAAVQHDLGNRISAAVPSQSDQPHPLVKILRDPNGVRQAVLLNEILQRPKSLRS